MSLKEIKSAPYLLSLEGYIRSCLDGELFSRDELIKMTQDGLAIAKGIKESLYILLFNLILFMIKKQDAEYHHYLSDQALPKFREYGYTYLIQRSEKELFNYYSKTNQHDKAMEIALVLINHEN
ncbi:hypothetical protein [Paenibacillus sp. Soil724D2]|uniref:hypothetical protein n=1 Tax=Paenibacillus sp. (strain Soil724D2) TaxID=1736392 RepID=UPI0012E3C963|nr:hypothetical protein [Paenibacillus sp. Soil724D2]